MNTFLCITGAVGLAWTGLSSGLLAHQTTKTKGYVPEAGFQGGICVVSLCAAAALVASLFEFL